MPTSLQTSKYALHFISLQRWFIDVWNHQLAPYLVEAVKEGVQLYGRRGAFADPCSYLRENWPWEWQNALNLKQIIAEDVGLEADGKGNDNPDPLLNMLMALQNAANYNGNQDSDCASIDSNITHDSSAGVD